MQELLQASAQHFEDAWTALREAEQRNLLHSPMGALVLKQVLLMAGAAVSVDQLCLNISNDKALLATMPRRKMLPGAQHRQSRALPASCMGCLHAQLPQRCAA